MHIPDQESRGHVSPLKVYFMVGSALLVLTVITVLAAQDYGNMFINVIIAMFIATIKASLVILYFMHMKYESKLIWGFGLLYPIVLFIILVGFVSMDVFARRQPELKPNAKDVNAPRVELRQQANARPHDDTAPFP